MHACTFIFVCSAVLFFGVQASMTVYMRPGKTAGVGRAALAARGHDGPDDSGPPGASGFAGLPGKWQVGRSGEGGRGRQERTAWPQPYAAYSAGWDGTDTHARTHTRTG